MNSIATYRINYIYKYDDNTYWTITSYRDSLGFIIPMYASQITYEIR